MADLTGAGEKQHGFAVFVLQAFDDFAVQHRNVVLQLAGRVRVEFAANIADQGFELGCRQFIAHGLGDAVVVLRLKHAALRKGELKDRVGRYLLPVDQLVDDVLVDPKGQHAGNHLHLEALLGAELLELRYLIQLLGGVDLEALVAHRVCIKLGRGRRSNGDDIGF